MTDTSIDEARVREILDGCEGVTPGPWKPLFAVEDDDGWVVYREGDLKSVITGSLGKSDAAHIASLDPDTVRALCTFALSATASRRAVVPLEWRSKENYSTAETPFGEYTVTGYEESDGIGWEAVYQDAEVIGTFPTEADARNACDALHTQRINSALSASPDHIADVGKMVPAASMAGPEGWVTVPAELDGPMWVAARKAFETEAERYRLENTTAMAMAIADRAPEKIYAAILAAAPAPALPEAKPVAELHRKEGLGPFVRYLPEAWKLGPGYFPLYASPVQVERAEAKPVASPAEGEAVRVAFANLVKIQFHAATGEQATVEMPDSVRSLFTNIVEFAIVARNALKNPSSDREAATREAVIEECAKVAETFDGPGHIFAPGLTADDLPTGWAGCRRTIAAALRALAQQAKPQQAKP